MAKSFKKLSIKTPALKKGRGTLAQGMKPLKTSSTYTKDALKFGSIGFGDTGLQETPSLLGMGKTAGFK